MTRFIIRLVLACELLMMSCNLVSAKPTKYACPPQRPPVHTTSQYGLITAQPTTHVVVYQPVVQHQTTFNPPTYYIPQNTQSTTRPNLIYGVSTISNCPNGKCPIK